MPKLSKEELARYSGAWWTLSLVDSLGREGAEKYLDERGIKGIPLAAKQSDLDKFCEEEKANTIATIMMMAAVTLRDEYDMDAEQIDRFIKRFNTKTECLLGQYVNWEELRDGLAEETGIKITLPEVFTNS
ncbi:MAG: hypothetical protein J6U42_05805 [Lachnospiraceae bacterium]|nr:hypothetical protein [Lachnospiraceae bacterium]